jgi:Protein of unknown function (DUF3574)
VTVRGSLRRRARGIAAAFFLVTAAGCGGMAPPPPPNTQALVRSELYFGRQKPDGSVVTDGEWRAFVTNEIAPRFPDGFTVLDALGQYRMKDGQIQTEPTKILLLVHPPETAPRAAIQALRDVYRRLFQQESVLLIESPARAGF